MKLIYSLPSANINPLSCLYYVQIRRKGLALPHSRLLKEDDKILPCIVFLYKLVINLSSPSKENPYGPALFVNTLYAVQKRFSPRMAYMQKMQEQFSAPAFLSNHCFNLSEVLVLNPTLRFIDTFAMK